MKRYCILALALVLGCTMFTGCRRRDGGMEITTPTTHATTAPTTHPTVEPTVHATTEPATHPATEHTTTPTGMEATDGATTGTEEGNARARIVQPDMR